MKIERYTEERDKLDGLYEKMRGWAEKLEAPDLAAILSESQKKLKEDSFKIVVVGEFSRGKSTFLNAMMGRRILPAKTDPTTTIINDIVYGEKLCYLLHYRDSETVKEISGEDFLKIKAVQTDDDDYEGYRRKTTELANIAYAEVKVPLDICRDGIELIDTPGTNDLDQVREEITYSFLPNADAAIFLLSAEQPVTRSEVEFIRERILKSDISKIFFVVNFKDRIEAKDQERIMTAVRQQLKQVVPSPRAYLVSSKGALKWRRRQANEDVKGAVPDTFEETGFADFEEALSRFLIEEKADTKLSKYRQRLLDVGTQLCRDRIAVRRNGIGASVKSIEAAIEEMRPCIERVRKQSDRAIHRLKYSLQMDVEELADDYERGLSRIARQARRNLIEYDGDLNIDEVASFLEERIAPLQEQHAQAMKTAISDRLNMEYSKAQKALQDIYQTEISAKARKALVPLTQPAKSVSQEVMTLDEVADGNAVMVGGGLIFGGLLLTVSMPFIAIPAALFGGNYILQKFRDYRKNDFITQVSAQVRERYEKIIPEQKAGFKRQLQRDFNRLVDDLEKTMDNELCRIEDELVGLLRDKQSAQRDDQVQRAFLDAAEKEIQSLTAAMRNGY